MNNVAKKVINGKEFQIWCLDADEGFEMGVKIFEAAAPMLKSEEGGEMVVDFGKIAQGLGSAFGQGEMLVIIKRLLRGAAVDGKEIKFGEYFSRNYGEMIKVTAFAIQENFGSFLEGLDILGED